MQNDHKPYGLYERYIKRPQDFICALLAIIVLSPVMLITAILVRIKLGSPVLFKQKRPGRNEKIFEIYKFRTMTDQRDDKVVRQTLILKLIRTGSHNIYQDIVIIKHVAMKLGQVSLVWHRFMDVILLIGMTNLIGM